MQYEEEVQSRYSKGSRGYSEGSLFWNDMHEAHFSKEKQFESSKESSKGSSKERKKDEFILGNTYFRNNAPRVQFGTMTCRIIFGPPKKGITMKFQTPMYNNEVNKYN